MENTVSYLKRILLAIGREDRLHAKTLRHEVEAMRSRDYWMSVAVIQTYFTNNGIKVKQIAEDYLHMIKDMRVENIKFLKTRRYSCESEAEAYEKIYSRPEVMSYYMNALMISQILWWHHFQMLQHFTELIKKHRGKGNDEIILDIGAGYGLYSKAIIDNIPNYKRIDVMDISETSLKIAESILGNDRIEYIHQNIKTFEAFYKYDIIILGEILEHLDNPIGALRHVASLLNKDGVIWLTVPTNAPAIDHVFLFRDKFDVEELIYEAGLDSIDDCMAEVDFNTKIIGAFCIKK